MLDGDLDERYRLSDALWERIKPLLPPDLPTSDSPQIDNREIMAAILYVLHTGCEWKELPPSLGIPSVVRSRFREWRDTGLFQRMWRAGILTYDELRTLFWYGRRHLQP